MTNLELLESLSKEDLIAVIANLTYTHNWRNDWSITKQNEESISKIALACKEYCDVKRTWDIDTLLQDSKN